MKFFNDSNFNIKNITFLILSFRKSLRSPTKYENCTQNSRMKNFLAKTKLIKPIVHEEHRVGIHGIRDKIQHIYNKYSKWTIIRDLEGL